MAKNPERGYANAAAAASTATKERDGFLRDLHHFHETRGTPYKRTPLLGGKEVDLHLLYTVVTAQGGWIKVNSKNGWTDILDQLRLPKECVNASVALKQIYLRYLDRWEKVHFLGEEADRGSDDDEESRHKRWSARSLHSVPLSYNYNQHVIADANREYNHLSADLYKPSDYDKLALSLLSPLPNEQDFAINVCTLISNDGKHTLKLEKHPRIVDHLLAHAGVFSHSSLRQLFVHNYTAVRKHPIHNFWSDVLEWPEFVDLADENPASTSSSSLATQPSNSSDNSDKTNISDNNPDPSDDCEVLSPSDDGVLLCSSASGRMTLRRDSTDGELFGLGRALGTQDHIGQRVLQIATILRNLSFIDENIAVLIRNKTFVRFVLLCAASRWNYLRNLGLDMLGNLAGEFLVKNYPDDRLATVLLKLVTVGLQSEDRAACISSLEALNKLSQNEANEDVLLRYLEREVYEKVCSFLTIHDVMLLIYTLECLYALSSLGEKSCNYIVANHGVVDTIVALVTVEGKSYGPKACIGMKLVETVSGGVGAVAAAASTATSAAPSGTTTAQSAAGGASSSTVTVVGTTAKVAIPASGGAVGKSGGGGQTSRSGSSATTTTSVTPSSQTQPLTPQQAIQQQHAHQQAIHENEQFALAWLRATYEPCTNGRIDHQELYKHYMNSCSKIGRRGVISPLHFPRCVRSVFGGTVGPNPAKPSNTSESQYYEGIKVMAHPHLSQALLGSTSSATSTSIGGTNTTTHQLVAIAGTSKDALFQQLSTTTVSMATATAGHSTVSSNTSLIKTLLATKVNDCMTSAVSMKTATATDCQNVAQVAARQQQQRLLAQQNSGAAAATSTTSTQEVKIMGKATETPKTTSRLNGARQLFADSTTESPADSLHKIKKEPPQPPPPLAPLSNNNNNHNSGKKNRFDTNNEDSGDNSTGNSVASSGMGTTGLGGGVSSTEDGENSLTSFEGLLNGIPNIENPLLNNDDSSNSKDSVLRHHEITKNKPLRLADLLEKKVDKTAPTLNGSLGKELRLGDKSMDLVENHIEKALSNRPASTTTPTIVPEVVVIKEEPADEKKGVKRAASDDIVESESKKQNVNGALDPSLANGDEMSTQSSSSSSSATVSTAAAKLFADMAADILKEEDEEMVEENTPVTTTTNTTVIQQQQLQQQQLQQGQQQQLQQIIVDNNQQVRQIIVSQQAGVHHQLQNKTVIVQNANATQNRGTGSMVLQQNPILLSQGSTVQLGQYVLQTSAGGAQQAYMVPQTAMVHGQPQTVLVAQTAQQQGSGTKTIIILQQQPAGTAQHHQKVVMTPQGQQVVVTQLHRPVMQSSTVTNNAIATATATVIKAMAPATSNGAVAVTTTTAVTTAMSAAERKEEEKPPPAPPQPQKPKIVRDLTTPFVCEWGECNLETKFKSANQVYMHVCEAHCPDTTEEIMCQWDRCDNMKRKRFSLMTHLHDKHCNTEAMKQSLTRRKQVSQGGKVEPPPAAPTNHPGYAPDAALHAIKRHALEFVNPKELQKVTPKLAAATPRPGPVPVEPDDNEGPVTKSIRLTASLILRNLVIYSSHCRRYLKHYEPHLANVALSNVESSRTIAQVLYDMNEGSNHR